MSKGPTFLSWISDIWFFSKRKEWNGAWFCVCSLFHYMYWRYFLGFLLWFLKSIEETYGVKL